jgi:2-polyprenyl-3-methyl-5-hydroxy-6-metoxy-1,4-benzoquinol methylase
LTNTDIQNNQYEFPYHYLPSISNNIPSIQKKLAWGFEYLTYMNVVIDEISNLNINNILDIGCGDGYLLNNLAINADKFGVDLSNEAILFAQAFSNNAHFEVKDLLDIKMRYDLVTLIEVMEHIPDDEIELFMGKALNLIKEGGYLIVSVPTTVVPVHKKHYRHYDELTLTKHVQLNSSMKLIKEFRIYKNSYLLKFVIKILSNNFWTINSNFILRFFWKWHNRYNKFATKKNGKHIMQIYKKI